MTDAIEVVPASAFRELKAEHDELRRAHDLLLKATREVQHKSYDDGREDARREQLRTRSIVQQGDGLAHLTLPSNGGAIQFHVVGMMGPRPITGGQLSKDPDYSLRIWGPPDASGSFGVHEQGGGNLTDFSMGFDLTPAGIVIHQMDVTGIRAQWDRET